MNEMEGTILEYGIPSKPIEKSRLVFEVEMPKHSRVFNVKSGDGYPLFYAIVPAHNHPKEKRRFVALKSGTPVTRHYYFAMYHGSFKFPDDPNVYHLIEEQYGPDNTQQIEPHPLDVDVGEYP